MDFAKTVSKKKYARLTPPKDREINREGNQSDKDKAEEKRKLKNMK